MALIYNHLLIKKRGLNQSFYWSYYSKNLENITTINKIFINLFLGEHDKRYNYIIKISTKYNNTILKK